jgi:hypothetical protein
MNQSNCLGKGVIWLGVGKEGKRKQNLKEKGKAKLEQQQMVHCCIV